MSATCVVEQLNALNLKENEINTKIERLRQLDFLILDNSIRETNVGQIRGLTVEDKIKIYEETKKCRFEYRVVAAFNEFSRVGDAFCQWLMDNNKDRSGMFAFSDITRSITNGRLNTDEIPFGILKCKKYGIPNVQFEFDVADPAIDWNRFSVSEYCQLLQKWLNWCYENLSPNSKILFGFRDFGFAMNTPEGAERVLTIVDFLGNLPNRGFGISFEETGNFLPDQIGIWCSAVRNVMNNANWQDGRLLVHLHKRWGLAHINQLECLMNGADGVWAGVCDEGAIVGHAGSLVTVMNLIRMGNTKVLNKYNCKYLRKAAINVTKITTGKSPHYRELICGERALDQWIADEGIGEREFDLASFFDKDAPIRVTDLASAGMFQEKLTKLFSEDTQHTNEMGLKMKNLMLSDLTNGRKEEHTSDIGFAMLFNRAGGKLTTKMRDVALESELINARLQNLINKVRNKWNEQNSRDGETDCDRLCFSSFYSCFMKSYFDDFQCRETQDCLFMLNIEARGYVNWSDFLFYLKWAAVQYCHVSDVEELLDIAFHKGLISAMKAADANDSKKTTSKIDFLTQNIKLNSFFEIHRHYQGNKNYLEAISR